MSKNKEPLGDIATTVLFENDKVRIWNLIVKPGEVSPWHLHENDYVTVCVEGGGLDVEFDDGTKSKGSAEVGVWTYHGEHTVHRVMNNTDKTYKNVLLELKK